MSDIKITTDMWYALIERVDRLEKMEAPLGPNPTQDERFQADRERVVAEILEQVPKPVDRSQRVLVGGGTVPEDGSHTENRGDGQQKDYVILSAAERDKGFVRPVRRSYKHIGPKGPQFPLRDLTTDEMARYADDGYAKFEQYPDDGSALGRYWTQDKLDRSRTQCGCVTTMAQSIAETFARDPGFYSGGFCCSCHTHFPNEEFVWLDDGTTVGS